ncbi:MAG: hypothetical protein B6242_11785 [Anaerolineaceae bacterium 4572_78]|nr:MAG: hypothetical protein B6242_11785 [Anaerolineaceae bacterium 4572_78]
MVKLIIRWVISAVAIWITTSIMPGIAVHGGVETYLLIAVVLGLVNALVRPVIMLLTCPFVILTLGLFTLIVNTMMLLLTAWFIPTFDIKGFWYAFFASLVISIVTGILSVFVSDDKNDDD